MPARPVLTSAHRRALAAAADRILPAGDGPAASDARVVDFLEWALGQESFTRVRERLFRGLCFLESLSQAMYGRRFHRCEPHEQDTLLRQVQATPHPMAQRFFVSLVNLTLAGFLGHPRYGGNRDAVGWKFIGFVPHAQTWDQPERRGR